MIVHLKGSYEPDSIRTLEKLTEGRIDVKGGENSTVLVAGILTAEFAASFPLLKHVVIPYAGVSRTTLDTVRQLSGVTLHNIHHNAAAASEMAITLMLAAVKQIIPADSAMRKDDWSTRYFPSGKLVEDSSVTVLGQGAVGSRVGNICRGMGASVTCLKRTPSEDCRGIEDLHEILPKTDILCICVPLTDETRGLIGARELELLPRGAVLVNTARGEVVQEEPLFRSLESGHLGGAGLDVWYNYPKSRKESSGTNPSAFDFSSLPNVVMSPHRGGALGMKELERRRIEHLACILNALAEQDTSRGRVNISRGY
ncbi:hypothetical protein CSA37_09475 [Candidatus Fermentibacteria bacterium]|nr:MAG: hypothetical protein CSA37_09475 [Candidatus Fermentibacteria bacterium]